MMISQKKMNFAKGKYFVFSYKLIKNYLSIIFLLFFTDIQVHALEIDWFWANPLPQGNDIHAIAYGNGTYVSVGDFGTVLTSTDGFNWIIRDPGHNYPLYDIAWNGSQFLAVYGSSVQSSTDGINWTPLQNIGDLNASLMAVTWGNDLFVAVGYKIATSSNGVDWDIQDIGTTRLNGITWTGSQFVAVGSGGVIATSPDGQVWTIADSGTNGHLYDVAWDGSLLVAVGHQVQSTSTDGVTWVAENLGGVKKEIIWTGSQFVASGYSATGGSIWTSSNGVNWSPPNGVIRNYLSGICWNGSEFVAVGDSGAIITSSDATNWTVQSFGTDKPLYDVVWNGNQFVAVGDAGAIVTSPDGLIWTIQSSSYRLHAITWDGILFVAVGDSGTIVTSFDGINWTLQDSGRSDNLRGIAWDGFQFVAVGWSGTVLTSDDGINWVVHGANTTDHLWDVIWSGNQYVAVGDYGTILTSLDGITWTSQSSGSTSALRGIAASDSVYVAVGGGPILWSENGSSWNPGYNPPGSMYDVAWTGDMFIIVGGNTGFLGDPSFVLNSTTGRNWQSFPDGVPTNRNLFGVGNSADRILLVGARGAILTSDFLVVSDSDKDGYASDVDCDDNNYNVNPGATEVCNGIDDDCDGRVDDGFNTGTSCVGIGSCGEGVVECADLNSTQCSSNPGGSTDQSTAEICDGTDNDCDGSVDEDFADLGISCTTGVGECVGTGTKICLANGSGTECDAVAGDPTVEICDGLDNDCDGTTDELLGTTTCGLGICSHTIDNCFDGVVQTCDPLEGASIEICDGLDNDCDGSVDEHFVSDNSCFLPGVCAAGNIASSCVEGVYTACQTGLPTGNDSNCNGVDEDCDGIVDESYVSQPTSCGIGVCASTGATSCVGGTVQDSCTEGTPVTEICDGLDNDCDGPTDEDDLGNPLTQTCYTGPPGTIGIGECKDGIETCYNGSFSTCEGEVTPIKEICENGTDENCDGEVSVKPTVGEIAVSADLISVIDGAVTASASFIDPNIDDNHTTTWGWGDGTITSPPLAQGERTVSGNHTYIVTGVYTITLEVSDNECGSDFSVYQFVVVYDPTGGFVTGGGWIDSPLGAYTPDDPNDPALTGKATFGFVSKYKKGATTPTGETEFQFKVADLNFHSDAYEWFVISGAKAQYKGSGTINGTGEYKFMLTAFDADINDADTFDLDRFRIKIWTEDEEGIETIIYDNGYEIEGIGYEDDPTGLTELGGGSIVIHKGK